MNTREDNFEIRRIVLALDPSADLSGALQAAADLAARLHAELTALFIEDENLFRTAELPFVRRIQRSSPQWEAFDALAMEQELRRLEELARRMIASEAQRLRLTWSFDVVRGEREGGGLPSVEPADLLVVGSAAGAPAGTVRAASRIRVAAGTGGPLLVLGPGGRIARFFLVAYDGSAGSDRSLAAAARLAGDNPLAVLVLGETQKDIEQATAAAQERLGERAEAVRFYPILKADISRICAIAESFGEASVLVLHADLPALGTKEAEDALNCVQCPVLLVR